MKRSLLVFTALASFALPALAPVTSLAQNRGERAEGQPRAERFQRSEARPSRNENPPARSENRQTREGGRADRSEFSRNLPRGEIPTQRDHRLRPEVERRLNEERRSVPAPADRPQTPRQQPDVQARPDTARPDRPARDQAGRREGPGEQDRYNRPDRNGDWRSRDAREPNRGRDDNRNWERDRNRPGVNQPHRPPQAQRPDRNRVYREFRSNWNRDRWQREWNQRHRSDWWRNDHRFRGWSGVRVGFYFAPGYGYSELDRKSVV